MPDYDVLVCGAGVGGLTAASCLSRQGRRVLVVDKHREAVALHKGELLQPRSLQILEAIAALAPLRSNGAIPGYRLTCNRPDGTEILALDYRQLPEPHNQFLVHYYPAIQSAIAQGLGTDVEVSYGTRLDQLVRDSAGRVVGARLVRDGQPMEVSAALVVGGDGRTSRVRQAVDIGGRMRPYRHQLVAFDLPEAGDIGTDTRVHLTPLGLRALYRMPNGRARLYVQVRIGEYRQILRNGVAAWADQLVIDVPALATLADPLRSSLDTAQVFPAWRFRARRWTYPGVALLGDAAHCIHPMAGQGMNSAIADAWELAATLADADVLTPQSVDAALSRYAASRELRLAFAMRMSHRLANLFTATSQPQRLVSEYLLSRNSANQRLRYIVTYNMSGLGQHQLTAIDRLIQFGMLPDPRAQAIPTLR